MYDFNFSSILGASGLLVRGIIGTSELAASGILLSLVLGIVVGVGRCSTKKAIYWPATLYVEVFRNIPVLVLMMWFYFALPIMLSIEVSAFAAATLALGLNSGAFSAEIIRSSVRSVPRAQWEAASAIGMSQEQQVRRIIVPQAFRLMIPAFTNRWIEIAKLTSLAAALAFPELLYSAKTIAAAYYNPIEAFTVVAFIYLAIILPLTQLVGIMERRITSEG